MPKIRTEKRKDSKSHGSEQEDRFYLKKQKQKRDLTEKRPKSTKANTKGLNSIHQSHFSKSSKNL